MQSLLRVLHRLRQSLRGHCRVSVRKGRRPSENLKTGFQTASVFQTKSTISVLLLHKVQGVSCSGACVSCRSKQAV
ncbi:hypothetical protein [Kingella potus]|uniref:hypothetical protein n=1 Tax=Kingella potus TaxID=265175 RepID=UPI001FD038A8|nr:hypothetical protein [Kingella potus]UOP01961.1 hypothetical protein LVJ84_10150 [Kingella potus]